MFWRIADLASLEGTAGHWPAPRSGTSTDKTIDGPVYGSGVEFAVASNVTFKVEYLRLEFDDTLTVRATDSNGGLRRFNHEIDAIDTVKGRVQISRVIWERSVEPCASA